MLKGSNMKVSLYVVAFALLLTPANSWRTNDDWWRNRVDHRRMLEDRILLAHPVRENDMCKTCFKFAEQTIEQLYSLIAKGGIIGGCSELCKDLKDIVKIPFVEVTCNYVCDKVGIDVFVKIIKEADLDPIYLCELTHLCPVNDYGDAKISNLAVTPNSGPQGLFTISFKYVSNNGTGTGELALHIVTVDGIPVDGNFFRPATRAGTYGGSFQLKAIPDPSCDPSQNPCEKWLPGEYTINMAICNGICGSKHPHSEIYDTAQINFSITGKDEWIPLF